MALTRKKVFLAVVVLLGIQAALVATLVHRESLTFDEDDHMFAGYMMWKAGDYGLNPEHPPLVKLLAAAPLLREKMWIPPARNRDFKAEAYLNGRDWLARNDGASQHLVFRMRMAALLLALALSLTVFFAAREWFGTTAALFATAILVFDPNIMAHSGLVTTDIGVSLFFLASIYVFYRYVQRPGPARLIVAGIVFGLLVATKHSGILLAPLLAPLILGEIAVAPRPERWRQAVRLCGGFAAMSLIAVLVLWSFYGFRYAARPAGLELSTSLAHYAAPLGPFESGVILGFAHLHLLPESYLMGLVDVKRVAGFYPTFAFGKVYAHGKWWYFPAVVLIKSTLALLALVCLTVGAAITGRLERRRELLYLFVPGSVYLAIAMASRIDIGARHILPLYAMAAIVAGAGAAALGARSRAWAVAITVLIAAHIASSLLVYPHEMAYANIAWGGPGAAHKLLSDSNVDWGQQLYDVKAWQDRHPGEECWFAYFARPEVDPATYGIRCHALPTLDTLWLGGWEVTPPVIHGTVLISAGDLSGCEWPSSLVNPYRDFQNRKPSEVIDDSVFVYRGDLHMEQAAALSRALEAGKLIREHEPENAMEMAREGVNIAPGDLFAETALGDAAAASGQREMALAAWQTAVQTGSALEPAAQVSYLPNLQSKIRSLQVTARTGGGFGPEFPDAVARDPMRMQR